MDTTIFQGILDYSHSVAGEYIKSFNYPFGALNGLKDYIFALGKTLPADYAEIKEGVWVHRTATVAPTAYIGAPAIVCRGAEIRHCAFIRGSAIVGEGCVVGNSTEIKNSVLFDGVQVPHYNYVGDSILGYRSHLGAGAITSNVKSDRTPVAVGREERLETGLKKLGAIVGDYAEIGCNCVLNPGTVIGRRTSAYPLTSLRGVYPADSIIKSTDNIVKRK